MQGPGAIEAGTDTWSIAPPLMLRFAANPCVPNHTLFSSKKPDPARSICRPDGFSRRFECLKFSTLAGRESKLPFRLSVGRHSPPRPCRFLRLRRVGQRMQVFSLVTRNPNPMRANPDSIFLVKAGSTQDHRAFGRRPPPLPLPPNGAGQLHFDRSLTRFQCSFPTRKTVTRRRPFRLH